MGSHKKNEDFFQKNHPSVYNNGDNLRKGEIFPHPPPPAATFSSLSSRSIEGETPLSSSFLCDEMDVLDEGIAGKERRNSLEIGYEEEEGGKKEGWEEDEGDEEEEGW